MAALSKARTRHNARRRPSALIRDQQTNTISCTIAPLDTHNLGMRLLRMSSMDNASMHMRLGNSKWYGIT